MTENVEFIVNVTTTSEELSPEDNVCRLKLKFKFDASLKLFANSRRIKLPANFQAADVIDFVHSYQVS